MTLTRLRYRYPRQFWVLLACLTFNRLASSLIWPFITLFIQEQTGAPLSQVTALLPVQSVATIIGISGVSVLFDRFGRKPLMISALILFSALMLAMSAAQSLALWAVLIALYGITQPMFMIGANAIVADIVDERHRAGAFALMRMMTNLSIALGPAIGGQFIAQSRLFAYFGIIAINLLLLPPVILLLKESLPSAARTQAREGSFMRGYGEILGDRPFMRFIAVLSLVEIAIALVFSLLSVYTKTYFGIAENQFGWLLSINAGMVVLLQFSVTRLTRRFPPLRVMMLASGIYVVALIMFGLAAALPAFMISMAVLTIGELMLAPTGTTVAASLAPADKRARYMGMYTLTYSVGAGIGPAAGGILADAIAPSAIWFGGAAAAAAGALGFLWLSRSPDYAALQGSAQEGLPPADAESAVQADVRQE
ncbi:MAG: MFS transporter [Anaerolineae bacterium]|nr:MFS transporter [Anaerolineae bacterium]NUQ05814.1 MFS transporter [Anaerolineae bacterium]